MFYFENDIKKRNYSISYTFRYLYKCARGSQWGDKLPVTWPVTWSSQQAEESAESSPSLRTEGYNTLSEMNVEQYHSDFDSEDDTRFSDGQKCTNNVDSDQTAP